MYQDVRNKMKIGDLIAFSGNTRVSKIIKWKTGSDISHVGMVNNIIENGEWRVELIESTTLTDLEDPFKGEITKGVQRHKLSERLKSYDGEAYWLPLKAELTDAQQAAMLSWLFLRWESETPYDAKGAVAAGLRFLEILGLERDADFSSLFCSEMVCRAYQIAGILPQDINASSETPADVLKYEIFNGRTQIK